ncbi:hypothetical protein FHS11_004715 [Mucilaginibacter gotjawali]|uniref:Uncharacterized protein n=1 Tax=Mucilaginibacter gotjawali TaxID=1550579 RepID=A0A839SK61_9SPHI|nr:hypothetical protein [Mucilaginibacter gotjawali]
MLKLADITNTNVELIWQVVKKKAKKRDISNLLGEDTKINEKS